MEIIQEDNSELQEQLVKPKVNTKDELILNIKEWIKMDNEIVKADPQLSFLKRLVYRSAVGSSPSRSPGKSIPSAVPIPKAATAVRHFLKALTGCIPAWSIILA